MKIVLRKSVINGKVDTNDSKSYLHRLLFLAFIQKDLPKVDIKLTESDLSNDIIATIGALNSIGADIKVHNKVISVEKKERFNSDKLIKLSVFESGTTLRFLLPVIAALGLSVHIYGEGRVLHRPLNDLIDLLGKNGYIVEHKGSFLTCAGKLNNNVFNIKGYISSQYISGLALAVALMDCGKISIIGDVVSKPYLELTFEVMKSFGYSFVKNENCIEIEKKEKLTQNLFNVEGDWSSAASLIAIGVFSESLHVGNINPASVQADSLIIDILGTSNAKLEFVEGGYIVKKSKLNAVSVDINSCPDLAPILAAILAFADGTSTLFGTNRLQDKESDRLQEISTFLDEVGRKYEVSDDMIRIFGIDEDVNVNLKYIGSDHRIAMAYTVLSQRNEGKTSIYNPQCVNKSFVNFYSHLENIGLIIEK